MHKFLVSGLGYPSRSVIHNGMGQAGLALPCEALLKLLIVKKVINPMRNDRPGSKSRYIYS